MTLRSMCNRCTREDEGFFDLAQLECHRCVARGVRLCEYGALEADLAEYEEKKQYHTKTMCLRIDICRPCLCHVAQRMTDANVKDEGDKTPGVTARDIRLAYALESLESALAAGREVYDPRARPGADQAELSCSQSDYRWKEAHLLSFVDLYLKHRELDIACTVSYGDAASALASA